MTNCDCYNTFLGDPRARSSFYRFVSLNNLLKTEVKNNGVHYDDSSPNSLDTNLIQRYSTLDSKIKIIYNEIKTFPISCGNRSSSVITNK